MKEKDEKETVHKPDCSVHFQILRLCECVCVSFNQRRSFNQKGKTKAKHMNRLERTFWWTNPPSVWIADSMSVCDSNSLEIRNKGQNMVAKLYVLHFINCCRYEDLMQSNIFKWFEVKFFVFRLPFISLCLISQSYKCVCVFVCISVWCLLHTHFINRNVYQAIISISNVMRFWYKRFHRFESMNK